MTTPEQNNKTFMLGLLLFCLVVALLPLQPTFGSQLSHSLAVTLSVFAIARGLNAVLSVAQGTEMSIEPMGVGVTLTPGQILDPLNDIIEQFSSILLVASASLGMQKIILLLGDSWVIRGTLLIVALLACWGIYAQHKRQLALKVLLILTLVRLLVPVMAITSYQLQDWLSSQRTEAMTVLETTRTEVAEMNVEAGEAKPSWLQNLRGRFDLTAQFTQIKIKAERGVEATVYLIAEFLLISVLLPVLFIYLLLRFIRRIAYL